MTAVFGIGGRVIAQHVERKTGLAWLVAKLRHRPTRCLVIERIDLTHSSVSRQDLP